MNTNRKLGIGILGVGFVAEQHAIAIADMPESLVAICDIVKAKADCFANRYQCKAFYNFDEFIHCDAIDLVLVCLPTFLHEEYVVQSLRAKKHVLCEKPFALTVEACKHMVEESKKNDVMLMVGQVIRFWPAYQQIKNLVDCGTIGELKSIQASRFSQFPSWSNWFKDPQKSGGALYDLHVHDIDFVRFLTGRHAKSVTARGIQSKEGAWNEVSTLLTMENGIIATIQVSNQMPTSFPFTMKFTAVGCSGVLEFSHTSGSNIDAKDEEQERLILFKDGNQAEEIPINNGNGYLNQLAYFVDAIYCKHPTVKTTLLENIDVMEIIEKIQIALNEAIKYD